MAAQYIAFDHCPTAGNSVPAQGHGALVPGSGGDIVLNPDGGGRPVIRTVDHSNTGVRLYAPPGNYIRIGARMRMRHAQGTPIVFRSATNAALLTIFRVVSGPFEVRRGATVLGTTSQIFPTNTWRYVEIFAYLHDTAGEVEIRFDGVEVLKLTGIDTLNVTDTCAQIQLTGTEFSHESYYTDIYVTDKPAFEGPLNFVFRELTADVSKQWTPDTGTTNFSRLTQAAGYVETFTLGDRDVYDFADLAPNQNSIVALVPVILGSAPSGGAPQARLGINDGTSEVQGTPGTLGATAGTVAATLTQQPGGGGWSRAVVNAARMTLEAA